MKKHFFVGALALAGILIGERPAQAWINFRFSAGINMSLQSGNNTFLWGLWRNGAGPFQIGAEYPYGCASGQFPHHGYQGQWPGFGQDNFPWFGNVNGSPPMFGLQYQYGSYQDNPTQPAPSAPARTGTTPTTGWYGNAHYQPASYHAAGAPSYWYGR